MAFMIARMTSLDWLFGTRRRVPAAQAWPLFMKAMIRADGIALSRTASSSRTVGDLPPSSSVTRFMVFAPSRMIDSPTATEPVNEILATSGLRTSSAATTLPRPVTTFRRPFGRLASCSASTNTRVWSELNSLGLMTTVQPAATGRGEL